MSQFQLVTFCDAEIIKKFSRFPPTKEDHSVYEKFFYFMIHLTQVSWSLGVLVSGCPGLWVS